MVSTGTVEKMALCGQDIFWINIHILASQRAGSMSRANSNIKDAPFVKSFAGKNKDGRYLYQFSDKKSKELLEESPEAKYVPAKDCHNVITIGQLTPCDVPCAFVDPGQDLFPVWTSGPLRELQVGTMYIGGDMIRRADDVSFEGKVMPIKKFLDEYLENFRVKMSNDEDGDDVVSRVSLK